MIIESTDKICGIDINTNEMKLLSADELVNDMYKEYNKYSKLLELAKKDRIETIKDTVRYMYYSEHLLEDAQKWIHMRDDKNLDKRKKYEEKESFEYLQNILRKEIFNNSTVKIESLYFEGYEKYLCDIQFKVMESEFTTFSLVIPNISKLSEKLWNNMHGGKLVLYYGKGNNSWYNICESYKEEDIAKGLIKYFLS